MREQVSASALLGVSLVLVGRIGKDGFSAEEELGGGERGLTRAQKSANSSLHSDLSGPSQACPLVLMIFTLVIFVKSIGGRCRRWRRRRRRRRRRLTCQ